MTEMLKKKTVLTPALRLTIKLKTLSNVPMSHEHKPILAPPSRPTLAKNVPTPRAVVSSL